MTYALPGFVHILLTREIWERPVLYRHIHRYVGFLRSVFQIQNLYCGFLLLFIILKQWHLVYVTSIPASPSPLLIHTSLFTKLAFSPPLQETSTSLGFLLGVSTWHSPFYCLQWFYSCVQIIDTSRIGCISLEQTQMERRALGSQSEMKRLGN